MSSKRSESPSDFWRTKDLGFAKEVNLNLIVQDLSTVATTSVDGGVKIWNAETGDCIQSLGAGQSGVRWDCCRSHVKGPRSQMLRWHVTFAALWYGGTQCLRRMAARS